MDYVYFIFKFDNVIIINKNDIFKGISVFNVDNIIFLYVFIFIWEKNNGRKFCFFLIKGIIYDN